MAPAPTRNLPQDAVDRPLAGFMRDYVDGESVPRHAHARAQLLYATGGIMRIETDHAAYVVPPGRALWVPAAVPHVTAMQGPVAMRALFLRADAARAGPAGVAVLAVSPLLRELILAACSEPLEWDEAGRGGHLAALILDEIARAQALPLGVPAVRDTRLRRLAAALRADPARDADLEAWAAECGASPRTLTRLFRRETGMSFARWRQMLRLSEAAALLAQGMPPARAAAAVGYASAPAFGAAFRTAFGTSPRGALAGGGPMGGRQGAASPDAASNHPAMR
ncbi:AraC family transcriptional regulator [Paracraurococcus ruber]|uniref:AraC family transcriptional regulator n=1 Tax=Paracraurococcus ruber TaxID=77675 RepID=A0ABS1D792_9PROT|nr:helix-turn-helix domain-containing protein [Paracraurococcus ruber]MBK1662431.1 AraC family transcriptional regulator [Paracraurococcus ruber]